MGIHPNTPSGLAELGSYCCELPDGIDLGSKLRASSPQVSAQHPKKPFRVSLGKQSSAAPVCYTQTRPGFVTGSIPTSSSLGRSPEGVFTVSGVLGEITTKCCLSACLYPDSIGLP